MEVHESKGKPVSDSLRNTRSRQQKIGTTLFTYECPNYLFQSDANPTNDIVWGSQVLMRCSSSFPSEAECEGNGVEEA